MDENENGKNEATQVAQKHHKPRRPRSKDEVESVTMRLDDETRSKLIDLNKLHQERAMCDLPLSTSLKFAITVAHKALFGKKDDQAAP